MKKIIFFVTIILFQINASASNYEKVYFAGGCFWCMEESFDKIEGVISVVSGYSGGHLNNPTYADVVYTDSGHVEAVEITYNSKLTTYEKLLDIYWQNIDPFDATGQFCDKGKSYRSVIFFSDKKQKDLIDLSFKKNEKMFNKKIVTLVWKFKKFYKAESYHQDYYEKNFIRYLMYKKGCQREETLEKIWN
ncbi:peptide-methionine (S)-S-oxide reductase MsrA [Pelagibacteraceae bacterium]|nr:peptide-methionine (S)-S-oxide reductase MsrA [Pelagibacteraceae bacterium]